MAVRSAGILLYRYRKNRKEIFLIHPGGPYWAGKDLGAWSIPKGIIAGDEDPLAAARREFEEETGHVPRGDATLLGTFRQPSGKQLTAWAVEDDIDPKKLASNSFAMIWPPQSGVLRKFPEADRGDWFARDKALTHITRGQRPLLELFFKRLGRADKAAKKTAG